MKNSWVVGSTIILLLSGLCFWSVRGVGAHTPLAAESAPVIAGCSIFPENNVWNTPVDTLPVHPLSSQYIGAIGSSGKLHPDFGSGLYEGKHMGIPLNIVTSATPKSGVTFYWPDESDSGPYPIPTNPLVEEGDDAHLLMLDKDACKLYELYLVTPPASGQGWQAGSGAIYDLHSNALRPATYTSADAAGLPMVPGLVRYDEVAAGHIDHALRFTVTNSKAGYVWPARHDAPHNTVADSPVMGLRFRLKASFNITGFPADVQVILTALKKYGMIIADNGSSWYISGEPDERWNNDTLHELGTIAGSNFEVVDESGLMVNSNSAQAAFRSLNQKLFIPAVKK